MITSSCYQLLLVFKDKIRARNRKVSAALINWAVKPFCVFKFGGRWKCAFQEMHTKNSYPKGFENDTRTKPLWVTSSLCFHGVIIFTLCSSTTSWQNPWKTSLLWYRFIFSTFRELKDWVRKSCLQWNPFPEGKGTSLVSLELPAAVTDFADGQQQRAGWAQVFQTVMPWPFGDSHPVIQYSNQAGILLYMQQLVDGSTRVAKENLFSIH